MTIHKVEHPIDNIYQEAGGGFACIEDCVNVSSQGLEHYIKKVPRKTCYSDE